MRSVVTWRTSSGWIAMMTGACQLLTDVHHPVEHRPVADVEGRDREVLVVRDVEDGLAGVEHERYLRFDVWMRRCALRCVAAAQLFTEPDVSPLMK